MTTRRNIAALAMAVGGVYLLTDVVLVAEPLGVILAFVNAALFAAYIGLGHRLAQSGAGAGIDRLGLALLIAALVITPIGGISALPALVSPMALLAGIAVGVSSSVVPYVIDQLVMARVKRSTFALLVALLPAVAALIGALILHQIPSFRELAGIGLVVVAIGLHRGADAR